MNQNKAKVLLVEDETEIAAFIATVLQAEGYEVQHEADGQKGLVAALHAPPDLIILDRLLPGLDGLDFCRLLRRTSDVPVLMLTALDKPPERVEGLNAGANDYLSKPFDLDELIARVKVQLRGRQNPLRSGLAFSDLSLDLGTREVSRGEESISLTPKEFDLLVYFLQHPRQVLTRGQIFQAVWGYDFGGEDNVLEVYIRYLRNKIEREDLPKLIHTVRGVGYVLKEAK
ncbi:MAG TPA: response regulator transcription factor [Chroococcales cyanobacterium]